MNNSTLKQKILLDFFENRIIKYSCNTESCKNLFNIETGKKDANFGSSDGKYNFYTCAIEPIKSDSYSYDGDYLILPGNGANVGVCLFYSGKFEAYQRTYLLSTLTDKIEIKYALYYFMAYWSDYNKNKMFGAAIPYIRLGNLQDFNIKYPISIKEQISIVNKIESLFVLVDRKEKNDQEKQKLKEVLKDRILDSAIHGSLIKNNNDLIKPDIQEINDEQPFLLHNNWIWVFINDITSNIQYGYTASTSDVGNARYLRITDIQNGCVNWESVPLCNISTNELSKYLLNKNDIVVARTGGTVGKNYLITDIPTTSVFASYLIRLVPNEYVDGKYLKYFMDSPLYWVQIADKSRGMAQPNVNGKSLSKLKMPLPPLEEQKKIVEKIEQCFELIEQL